MNRSFIPKRLRRFWCLLCPYILIFRTVCRNTAARYNLERGHGNSNIGYDKKVFYLKQDNYYLDSKNILEMTKLISTIRKLITAIILTALIVNISACRASGTKSDGIDLYAQQTDSFPGQVAEWPKRTQAIRLGQDLKFDTISVEDGLSQSTIFCILQDRQGFLWFGTEDGLNKFDGYSFTIYKHDPEDHNSLDNNWIQVLHEDSDGIIWIGTINGLDRFNPENESFTHYKNDPFDSSSLSHNNVTSIVEDQEGNQFALTTE